MSPWGFTPDEGVALCDYFHPPIYQETVVSRIPVGKGGSIVQLNVDPYRLGMNMANSMCFYFLYADMESRIKWFKRSEYFFSVFSCLLYDKKKIYKQRDNVELCYTQLRLLFEIAHQESRWAPVDDSGNHRKILAEKIKSEIDSMNYMPEKMRDIWIAESKAL